VLVATVIGASEHPGQTASQAGGTIAYFDRVTSAAYDTTFQEVLQYLIAANAAYFRRYVVSNRSWRLL